jgi:DNA-directed RNA polymerase subunit N (RpoN/RPB10)
MSSLIPIKCFTCGNVLADKYLFYIQEINKVTKKETYAEKDNFSKTIEGTTLDNIGLNSICCRRHLLTHVEIN